MSDPTATSTTGGSGGGGGRGPAPPLPDKPPSVAERTRLLRSSFRKDEVEKPRPPDNRSLSSVAPPPLPEKPTLVGSTPGVHNNGSERSPSPGPVSSNKNNAVAVTITSNAVPDKTVMTSSTSSSSSTHSQSPPQQQPQSQNNSPPTDVNGKNPTNKKDQNINAAKRDAFFRASAAPEAPTVKFDPGSRFGHDRERPTLKQEKELIHSEMDKDKERDRKYGGETRKELEGYVGFANLPNQVYRKSVKKGFEFTLMVVGECFLRCSLRFRIARFCRLHYRHSPEVMIRPRRHATAAAASQFTELATRETLRVSPVSEEFRFCSLAMDARQKEIQSNKDSQFLDFTLQGSEIRLQVAGSGLGEEKLSVHCCGSVVSDVGAMQEDEWTEPGMMQKGITVDNSFNYTSTSQKTSSGVFQVAEMLPVNEWQLSRCYVPVLQVDTSQSVLKENGVQLKLTVVDTPGFGDAVDNSNCWSPITDYIDSKYEEYLNSESRVNRTTMPDTRVHCCLYFIAPTGHGLKPLDVEFMKRLHEKVNIIPLIAKADTLTPDECREFKKTILNEIAQHKIKIYEFPECDDEEEMKIQKRLRDRVPFAVVGSNRVIELGGKRLRGRQYPWGIVEVENLEHNDFIALRNMLIRTHMQDLKDVTNNVHYENFRYNKLAPSTNEGKVKPGSLTKDPLTQMAEERQEHNLKMKKMEAEMEQVFEMKVKEKKQKLKDSEADLQKRSEQMKKSLEQQQREMDDKWKGFEREKAEWEHTWGERRRSLENQKDSLFPFEEDHKGKKSPKGDMFRLGGSLRRGEHSGRCEPFKNTRAHTEMRVAAGTIGTFRMGIGELSETTGKWNTQEAIFVKFGLTRTATLMHTRMAVAIKRR
ncbi:protein peanut-like [Littorina saxatilis]|uniref:protein peanut-like n=1 Tax=Littorina saxatilis TaxID=31220 RepID=UPI0038B581DB